MKTKKIIIISLFLAIACLVTGIAGGIFISLKRSTSQNLSPEHYFSKSEQVSSITDIVGERSTFTSVNEASPDNTAVLESSDENGNADISNKAENGTAASSDEAEAAPKSQPLEKASESSSIIYNYSSNTVQQDVADYVAYLKSEKNFIEITNVRKNAQDESSTTRYLAGASQDEDSYLSITISEGADSYSISAVKENQPWNSFLTELWNTSYHQFSAEETSPTIVSAEEHVRSASQQFLNLPHPTDAYRFISKRGLIRVNNNDYYCVSAYLPNEIGTFDYECAFLVDAASGAIKYQYDESTGETFLLQ